MRKQKKTGNIKNQSQNERAIEKRENIKNELKKGINKLKKSIDNIGENINESEKKQINEELIKNINLAKYHRLLEKEENKLDRLIELLSKKEIKISEINLKNQQLKYPEIPEIKELKDLIYTLEKKHAINDSHIFENCDSGKVFIKINNALKEKIKICLKKIIIKNKEENIDVKKIEKILKGFELNKYLKLLEEENQINKFLNTHILNFNLNKSLKDYYKFIKEINKINEPIDEKKKVDLNRKAEEYLDNLEITCFHREKNEKLEIIEKLLKRDDIKVKEIFKNQEIKEIIRVSGHAKIKELNKLLKEKNIENKFNKKVGIKYFEWLKKKYLPLKSKMEECLKALKLKVDDSDNRMDYYLKSLENNIDFS